jgi:hypothetical protein
MQANQGEGGEGARRRRSWRNYTASNPRPNPSYVARRPDWGGSPAVFAHAWSFATRIPGARRRACCAGAAGRRFLCAACASCQLPL